MGWRPLAWMGEITYGFYLWHIPLLVFARGTGVLPTGIVLGLVVLPVAIAFGAASWYWSSGRSCAARRGCRATRRRTSGPRRPGGARSVRYRSQVRTIAFANPSP